MLPKVGRANLGIHFPRLLAVGGAPGNIAIASDETNNVLENREFDAVKDTLFAWQEIQRLR